MEGALTWGSGVSPSGGRGGRAPCGGAGAEPPAPKIFDIFTDTTIQRPQSS